jgi:hypothetical protein
LLKGAILGPETARKPVCINITVLVHFIFACYQTLSDEDSFKKCSNVEDEKSKIKQLINSLLHR